MQMSHRFWDAVVFKPKKAIWFLDGAFTQITKKKISKLKFSGGLMSSNLMSLK
jgi:hypothetical protein